MNSVIQATGYVLMHAPDMLVHNGTTQTAEREHNAESEYLKQLPQYLRSFQEAVEYLPNQTYIGNLTPEALAAIEQPWYDKPKAGAARFGAFGEIMPQDEFLLLLQASDVFDLVRLSAAFVSEVKPRFAAHPLMGEDILCKVKEGVEEDAIAHAVREEHAEPLYHEGTLVGYVRRAHDVDPNLSAHTMLENLVAKAGSVLALLHVVSQAKVEKGAIQYVIDCSEEACGDMNQRGGGNFAKAAAEIAGLTSATGCDVRAFCAAPTHAMILAASLVSAGVYENVIVTAGGCSAKLGMNGKDHVKKGIPLLEDVLGGFAVLVGKNDGVSPEIVTDMCGRHTVGTGSSPQAVITSLVTDPLDRAGLRITDIDKFSVEMQNPDVTKPAGAGDVPLANYKMIAALAVKRNEIERDGITAFVEQHGMVGWAPTQGHIPSGVPYLGFARQEMLAGSLQRAMIIGKGSLFLGRMTNLFDGVSFVIRKNSGEQEQNEVSQKQIQGMIAKAMREFAKNLMREQR